MSARDADVAVRTSTTDAMAQRYVINALAAFDPLERLILPTAELKGVDIWFLRFFEMAVARTAGKL